MKPIRLFSIFITSLLICCLGSVAQAADAKNWVASWGASPFVYQSFGPGSAPGPYTDQTVRQLIRISVGGEQVRIRLSNEHGTTPLVIGAASVGIVDNAAAVKSGSLHALTFGGKAGITIPPGAPAVSDPVNMSVADLAQLAISLYLPESTPASTVHMGRHAYISATGNYTQSTNLPSATQDSTMLFMTGVYVLRDTDTRVIVALGDSITDGTASTPYTYNSWPDHLAQRLENEGIVDLAIINHGISGNQVLRDGAGISALARFDRDVLATPGLTHIIVMEGINDIGTGGMNFPGVEGPVPEYRSAAEIIGGYQQLINRAHSMSPAVRIIGATLTPFEGSFPGYYSPEKDLIRKEVNQWIRSSGAFDEVIDFDKAIGDPKNPNIIAAKYNSGDSLHPGDLGYKHMAEFIDLAIFE